MWKFCKPVVTNFQKHMFNVLKRTVRLVTASKMTCEYDIYSINRGILFRYISECVTVYENANTMVRLFNSFGPYRLGTIRVRISLFLFFYTKNLEYEDIRLQIIIIILPEKNRNRFSNLCTFKHYILLIL